MPRCWTRTTRSSNTTLCTTHARMAKKVTQAQLTTTIRKSAIIIIIIEYDSGKATPDATFLTATDSEKFFVENTKEGKHENRSFNSSKL